ncbi:MAG: hypothetical protein GXY87_04800 [Tissierellia bacterium]|nr:hypothetical protein [Tissierellia bacterium]
MDWEIIYEKIKKEGKPAIDQLFDEIEEISPFYFDSLIFYTDESFHKYIIDKALEKKMILKREYIREVAITLDEVIFNDLVAKFFEVGGNISKEDFIFFEYRLDDSNWNLSLEQIGVEAFSADELVEAISSRQDDTVSSRIAKDAFDKGIRFSKENMEDLRDNIDEQTYFNIAIDIDPIYALEYYENSITDMPNWPKIKAQLIKLIDEGLDIEPDLAIDLIENDIDPELTKSLLRYYLKDLEGREIDRVFDALPYEKYDETVKILIEKGYKFTKENLEEVYYEIKPGTFDKILDSLDKDIKFEERDILEYFDEVPKKSKYKFFDIIIEQKIIVDPNELEWMLDELTQKQKRKYLESLINEGLFKVDDIDMIEGMKLDTKYTNAAVLEAIKNKGTLESYPIIDLREMVDEQTFDQIIAQAKKFNLHYPMSDVYYLKDNISDKTYLEMLSLVDDFDESLEAYEIIDLLSIMESQDKVDVGILNKFVDVAIENAEEFELDEIKALAEHIDSVRINKIIKNSEDLLDTEQILEIWEDVDYDLEEKDMAGMLLNKLDEFNPKKFDYEALSDMSDPDIFGKMAFDAKAKLNKKQLLALAEVDSIYFQDLVEISGMKLTINDIVEFCEIGAEYYIDFFVDGIEGNIELSEFEKLYPFLDNDEIEYYISGFMFDDRLEGNFDYEKYVKIVSPEVLYEMIINLKKSLKTEQIVALKDKLESVQLEEILEMAVSMGRSFDMKDIAIFKRFMDKDFVNNLFGIVEQVPRRKSVGLLGILGGASLLGGLFGDDNKSDRFEIGDLVRVRWRGQEGRVISKDNGLYYVKTETEDGKMGDYYSEDDLEGPY